MATHIKPPANPMPQPILYWLKKHFGRKDRIFIDAALCDLFQEATGRTVLLDADVAFLRRLGISFKEVAKPANQGKKV